jgi:hypothetical protein
MTAFKVKLTIPTFCQDLLQAKGRFLKYNFDAAGTVIFSHTKT